MDMGVEPFLLVSTLRLIVGQRLVRRLCDDKVAYTPDAMERGKVAPADKFESALGALTTEKLLKEGTKVADMEFYHPKPGGECEDGYKSRIGIHEIMTVSPTIRDLVLHNASPDAIEAQARKEGMLTMLEDGLYKAARGVTSLEEVLRAVNDG
jgi:type II secretory ATPase GspE/PulE/Tfp pilus assembly ATPase PilB-like protein